MITSIYYHLCCCILSRELSMLHILICRKNNSVGGKIDKDDVNYNDDNADDDDDH